MVFEGGTFFLSWLLAMVSEFLDQSFLLTVAITIWIPCYGFRDNTTFFSLEYILVFLGCAVALCLRTFLVYKGVDHFKWDPYCYAAGAGCFLVAFIDVVIKWRRAVWGRSDVGTALGRKMPEQRETLGTATNMPALELGRAPMHSLGDTNRTPVLALEDGGDIQEVPPAPPNATTGFGQEPTGNATMPAARALNASLPEHCGRYFLTAFLMPFILVVLVAAGDQQTVVFENISNRREDVEFGTSCGLICSTIIAVAFGRLFKYYFQDTHLLMYLGLCFFGLMVTSGQGRVIHMMQRDLPTPPVTAGQVAPTLALGQFLSGQ